MPACHTRKTVSQIIIHWRNNQSSPLIHLKIQTENSVKTPRSIRVNNPFHQYTSLSFAPCTTVLHPSC